jgi:hypothetical protein
MDKNILQATVVAAALLLGSMTFAGQQTIGGWILTSDPTGNITSMVLQNPVTYLNIESVVTLNLDNAGLPTTGTIKFRNNVERDLNPGEVIYFWDNFRGAHSVWENFASLGRLDLFNPDDAVVPANMYNRPARVITKAGAEYIGRLLPMAVNPDWFYIDINGHTVSVYRHAIAMLQEQK